MSTMTLEPCPFCGKSGPFDQWPCEWLDATEANIVRCPHCHGAAPMATWNTRAHLSQPAQAVDVVELAAALMEHLPDNRAPTRHELIRALTLTRAISGEKAGPVSHGWSAHREHKMRMWTITSPAGDVASIYDQSAGVHAEVLRQLARSLPASPAPDKEG